MDLIDTQPDFNQIDAFEQQPERWVSRMGNNYRSIDKLGMKTAVLVSGAGEAVIVVVTVGIGDVSEDLDVGAIVPVGRSVN